MQPKAPSSQVLSYIMQTKDRLIHVFFVLFIILLVIPFQTSRFFGTVKSNFMEPLFYTPNKSCQKKIVHCVTKKCYAASLCHPTPWHHLSLSAALVGIGQPLSNFKYTHNTILPDQYKMMKSCKNVFFPSSFCPLTS